MIGFDSEVTDAMVYLFTECNEKVEKSRKLFGKKRKSKKVENLDTDSDGQPSDDNLEHDQAEQLT